MENTQADTGDVSARLFSILYLGSYAGCPRIRLEILHLLLMDEPFSALDVLTAETLRTDFLDLWTHQALPTRSVLMVTHNIEEAVLMCDRILLLGSHPGRISAQIPVPLPRPRDRLGPAFQSIVTQIYEMLTDRLGSALDAGVPGHGPLAHLPNVSVHRITGLLETLASPLYQGNAPLARIATRLALDSGHLLPVAEALHLLGFARIMAGHIKLTTAGRVFVQSSPEERRRLFREHLLGFAPFVAHIQKVLEERADHRAPRERFELELQDHLSHSDAERSLRAAISWGRYAELFDYDDAKRSFRLR